MSSSSKNSNAVAKVDVNEIAQINADMTNGFNSKDLLEALKMVQEAGLNAEAKPLSEWILTDDRILNYGSKGNPISLEADVVLTLRAKVGDSMAVEQLLIAHRNILEGYVSKLIKSTGKTTEECRSLVHSAYMECINATKISYHGHLFKSTTPKFLDRFVSEAVKMESRAIGTIYSCNANVITARNAVKRGMEKNHIEIKDLTIAMIEKLMPEYAKHNASVEGIYQMLKNEYSVSYEELTSENDDDSDNRAQKRSMLTGLVASGTSLENSVLDKLEMESMLRVIKKKAEDELCVVMFTDYYSQQKGSVTYKDIAEKYHIEGGEAEIKKLFIRAQRMLLKALEENDPEMVARIKKNGLDF